MNLQQILEIYKREGNVWFRKGDWRPLTMISYREIFTSFHDVWHSQHGGRLTSSDDLIIVTYPDKKVVTVTVEEMIAEDYVIIAPEEVK